MSEQPQSSSNETHYSFAAPAQINDTPGSVESGGGGGGGGTISYVAPGTWEWYVYKRLHTDKQHNDDQTKRQKVTVGEIPAIPTTVSCH